MKIDFHTVPYKSESFYQRIGAKALDVMINEDIRQLIENSINFNYDHIAVINVLERSKLVKSMLYPEWNESILQTLRECVTNRIFTAARKVSEINPKSKENIHKEMFENYLTHEAVSRFFRHGKNEKEVNSFVTEAIIDQELATLKQQWNQKIASNYQELLYLRMYKENISLLEQLKTEQNVDTALNNIRHSNFDTSLCSYDTYGRIIALIFASRYDNRKYWDQFLRGSCHTNVSILENTLSFNRNAINQYIRNNGANDDYDLMHIPIMIDILEDFLSHTAGILGELMEGKRCLTGGDCSGIYDPFFCMPASQYIAVWKEGNIELWACDPNIEGLLQNISDAKALYMSKNFGFLEYSGTISQV